MTVLSHELNGEIVSPATRGGKMPRCFSASPSLQAIEKEARHLLNDVRRGDPAATARWYSLDLEVRSRQPGTADVQYVIAREYGFKSWKSLRDQLNKDKAIGRVPQHARGDE